MISRSKLEFANREEVKRNVIEFNKNTPEFDDVKKKLVKQAIYFVYDQENELFAPVKFSAFKNMSIDFYRDCQRNPHISNFDGHKTRRYVEEELNLERDNGSLISEFENWTSRFSVEYNYQKGPIIFTI